MKGEMEEWVFLWWGMLSDSPYWGEKPLPLRMCEDGRKTGGSVG